MTIQKQNLVFSDTPGSYERHLMRKHNNPLFSDITESVTQAMVAQAQQQDQQEYEKFIADIEALYVEISELSGQMEFELVLNLKDRIHQLYNISACFSKDMSDVQKNLSTLNDIIMKNIRQEAANNPLAISELDKEQAALKLHHELLSFKIVADLIRPESPILPDELVPSLLSESAKAVSAVMTLFDQQQQQLVQQQAEKIMQSLNSTALTNEVQQAYNAMQANNSISS